MDDLTRERYPFDLPRREQWPSRPKPVDKQDQPVGKERREAA